MAKFNFKIKKYDLFRLVDSFEFWVSANNKLDAFAIISKAYPEKLGYDFELINIE